MDLSLNAFPYAKSRRGMQVLFVSGIHFIECPVPTTRNIAATRAIRAFLLGVGLLDTGEVEAHYLNGQVSLTTGIAGMVYGGHNDFFQSDGEVGEFIPTARAVDAEHDFFDVLAFGDRLEQFR